MQKYLSIMFTLCVLAVTCVSAECGSVAIIKSSDIVPYRLAADGFKGRYNGRVMEYIISREIERNMDVLDSIKADTPDVVLAVGSNALRFVIEKVSDLPVVYCMVVNPEKCGVMDRSNVVGVSVNVAFDVQLSGFKSLLPGLKRLGMVYNPQVSQGVADKAHAAAGRLGVDLVTQRIRSPKGAPKALRKLIGKIDALWLIADGTVVNADSLEFILLFTLENGIPLLTYSEAFVRAGALMSLSIDHFNAGEQAADVVNDMINGDAERLPSMIEADYVRTSINMVTARAIGLDVPESVLEAADKVFE